MMRWKNVTTEALDRRAALTLYQSRTGKTFFFQNSSCSSQIQNAYSVLLKERVMQHCGKHALCQSWLYN